MEAPEGTGPYRAEQLLAVGAHAAVWLAADPDGEGVVLKVPRGAAGVEALRREAEVLVLGTHPHLPRLIEVDPDFGWLACEPIVGDALDVWAQDRKPSDIARVAAQLADALAWLHEQGVVHGDVKPANVLVDDHAHATLLDLGIAVRAGETRTHFRGTLGFAAPELLAGETPSAATDLWALGAAVYDALAGCLPFRAPDPAALTWLPGITLPMPVSTWRHGVSEALDDLLGDLLARRASCRPASAIEARNRFEAAASGRSSTPTLGNVAERDSLARAIVEASDGGSATVVVYGPIGSGKRRLVREAAWHAAREGLGAPGGDVPYIHVEEVVAGSKLERPNGPGAWILLSDRPLPELADAKHIAPIPLGEDEVARLLLSEEIDVGHAAAWWRETLGHAGAVTARIRAEVRAQSGRPFVPEELSAPLRVVFDALEGRGNVKVSDLAHGLSLNEHELVDRLDLLVAEHIVAEAESGSAVYVLL